MKVIGLTGGTGSGKSTVAGFLAELGAAVINVDEVGHEALKKEAVKKRLVREFGDGILAPDGGIDRARLGKLVFGNEAARARLNGIMHPVIFKMVDARLAEYRHRKVRAVVLDAPLMLEVGRQSQADEVWVTAAPEAAVIRRLRDRAGLSADEAAARIRTQLPGAEKMKLADVVIDTDCPLDELKDRVTRLWQQRVPA
jgi:dephospho-CoA kinase